MKPINFINKSMNKNSYVLYFAILFVALVGFASYSFTFANAGSSGGGQKNPPSIVGVVTDIQGAILTIVARDNNTYTVDASRASVVTGFIGPWAKPSSLADIAVTETLTIKGDINGASINAVDIAHNKTPQDVLANNPRLKTDVTSKSVAPDAPQISTSTEVATTTYATSTDIFGVVKDTVATVVDKVVEFITGTTTSTTTEDQTAATTTATSSSDVVPTTTTAENVNISSSTVQEDGTTDIGGTSTNNASNTN